MLRRTATLSLVGLFVVVAVGACAGSSEGGDGDENGGASGGSSPLGGSTNGGSAGTSPGGKGGSGTSGTSGANAGGTTGKGGSATGGSAGMAPSGGDAGIAPNGGVSGSATGGTGGTGASGGGGGRECESADDCVLFTDCCNCEAVPDGTSIPGCDLVCIQSRCSALQIRPTEVTCSFGRCVIDRSCDLGRITCNEPSEPCAAGLVGSVTEDGCHGPCLPPTECRDVTNCSSCGDAVCVIEEPQIASFGCVRPADSCTKGSYCDCLGACPTSGFECMEADDAVHCPCPVCS